MTRIFEAKICVSLVSPVQLPKSVAEQICNSIGSSLYVPITAPKPGELKRFYQTLGLSYNDPVHLGLTQIGFKDIHGTRVPVLKDDLGFEVPQWIVRFSRQLFSRSDKNENLPNVVLKTGKMFLIPRNTKAYAICVSIPEGK